MLSQRVCRGLGARDALWRGPKPEKGTEEAGPASLAPNKWPNLAAFLVVLCTNARRGFKPDTSGILAAALKGRFCRVDYLHTSTA
jgi:hypothetical protein